MEEPPQHHLHLRLVACLLLRHQHVHHEYCHADRVCHVYYYHVGTLADQLGVVPELDGRPDSIVQVVEEGVNWVEEVYLRR